MDPLDKFHAVLFLTQKCNLDCLHCPLENKTQSLSVEDLRTVASYGPRKVNFLGGEPLLYDRLETAFGIFSDVPITVQSNCLLVEENIDLLKEARSVICSVEGNKPTTDYIRGNGRDFSVYDKVMESAELLKNEGVDVLLRASVWRENLNQIPGLIEKADEMGVKFFVFPRMDEPPPSPREQSWLFEQFSENDNAWIDQPHFFCTLGAGGFCAAGERRIAVKATKEVVPCQWMTYLLGYVGDDFDIIQRSAETFVNDYKKVPPGCEACNWSDKCGGSCFLTNWHSSCPIKPELKRVMPVESDFGGISKSKTIKNSLKGVVTC